MLGWQRPVSFVNGRVQTAGGEAASIRFSSRVLAFDEPSSRNDLVVDLEGAFVLPGLVNAHDHLELNHYGPLKCRERYDNATEWIDDLRPALQHDAAIRMNSGFPLRDRLFIGVLKNLLAGVTTVAHHNPLYRELRGLAPLRLLRSFGWAHSFGLEGRPVGAHGEKGAQVRAAFQDTPAGVPFIVHMGEGVDRSAEEELTRLDALGCLKPNTVVVHGVAMNVESWRQTIARGASLVWCPASNRFLFGRTIPARAFLDAAEAASRHLCIGTDSRLTGARDLLEELRAASTASPVTAVELLRMVTTAAASVLRLAQAGRLVVGGPADLIVLPPLRANGADTLLATRRADIECVAVGGRPLLGARRFGPVFKARDVPTADVAVDAAPKLASARLAHDLGRCPIKEPGVSCV